jgi:hypothetical protein
MEGLGEGFSTCILIDDYNVDGLEFDWHAYRRQAPLDGIDFDYWCLESSLVAYTSEVYDLLGDCRERRRELRYVRGTGKQSCSFLTCTWYLVRVGALDPERAFSGLDDTRFSPGTSLVNILPQETARTEVIAHRLFKRALGLSAPEVVNHFY